LYLSASRPQGGRFDYQGATNPGRLSKSDSQFKGMMPAYIVGHGMGIPRPSEQLSTSGFTAQNPVFENPDIFAPTNSSKVEA
jgi:hypothetical protein